MTFEFTFACMPQANSSGGWDVSVLGEDDRIVETRPFDDFWEAMNFRSSVNGGEI